MSPLLVSCFKINQVTEKNMEMMGISGSQLLCAETRILLTLQYLARLGECFTFLGDKFCKANNKVVLIFNPLSLSLFCDRLRQDSHEGGVGAVHAQGHAVWS